MVRRVFGGKGVEKTASMDVHISGGKMEKTYDTTVRKRQGCQDHGMGGFLEERKVGSLQIGSRFRSKEDGVLREFMFEIIER